jgi:hypothetical protein
MVPLGDRVFDTSQSFSFSLPPSTFVYADAGARVTVEMRQANGRPLPGWMRFDPATGTLRGQPPQGFDGTLNVVVIARDNKGREATSQMRLRFDKQGTDDVNVPEPQSNARDRLPHAEAFAEAGDSAAHGSQELTQARRDVGKASLNEQFARYGRPAWESSTSTLIHSAELAAAKRAL